MAIYHLSVKPISRSSGRSATASSAYRSGELVYDETTGQTFDYTRKQGVEHAEIVLPVEAARHDINWARDRQALWNEAEKSENRSNSRVAREYEIALPHELSKEQRVDLVRGFAQEIADRHGVAVDFAIHQPHREGDQRNHHAHLMATTRVLEPDGLGEKATIEWSDSNRAKAELGPAKEEIVEIRERWATLTNERLLELGIEARIDHRSLEEQGIERQPTVHLGPAVTSLERRGIETEVGDRVREEQRIELQVRLEKAAELGALEREKLEVEKGILDLSGDLKGAVAERDRALAIEKDSPQERDPFAGLVLKTEVSGARKDPFQGLVLERSNGPEQGQESGLGFRKERELRIALDRYARAWGDIRRMPEQGLDVLPHQKVELEKAGQSLDQVQPGATADIRMALQFEGPGRGQAKQLESRELAQRFGAMLANEERMRQHPELAAERFVRTWKALDKQHEELSGAMNAEARKEIEGQFRELTVTMKGARGLQRSLHEHSRSLGIEHGSSLDRALRAKTLERALELSLPERSRGLELGR